MVTIRPFWRTGNLAAYLGAILLAAAPPALAQRTTSAVKTATPEYPGTRSITLPGSRPPNSEPQPDRPPKTPDADLSVSVPSPEAVAASLALAQTAGAQDAKPHYQTAVVALKDGNLAIAAEEMKEAAKLSPENALVLYGLAVVESQNEQPDLALPYLEKALQLGLPVKESASAANLITSIRYSIKKNEAEQKQVTPIKLWGSYDVPLDEPVQEFVDHGGHTYFQTRTPVSREMFLWKIDGESTIIGHWLEKNTRTAEMIYANSKRRDLQPKTTTEEQWWLVTILINPDGSLDGSRLETCFRQTATGCQHDGAERGRVVAFKGTVEPNGDLTILQDGGQAPVTLKKKSRVTSLPPAGVGIQVE